MIKKYTKFLSLVLVGVIMLTTGALACAPQPAAAPEPVVWRFHEWNIQPAPGSPWMIDTGCMNAAKEIAEKSDGKLVVDVYWSGELGYQGPEVLDSLKDGTLEMSMVPVGMLAISDPWCGIESLPLILDSIEQREPAMKALEPLYEELAARYGCKLLANLGLCIGYVGFHHNGPIRSLEFFDGLKTRVYAKYHGTLFEKLGATPVFMGLGEFYPGLKTGVVDAGESGENAVPNMKLDEVTDYCTNLWPEPLGGLVFVSKKHWDPLPEDVKQIVVDAFRKAENRNYAEMAKIDNEQHLFDLEYAEEHGLTIEFLSDELLADMKPYAIEVWAQWLSDSEAAGQREEAERAFVAVAKAIGKEELLKELSLKYY